MRKRGTLGLILLAALMGSACASGEPTPVLQDPTPTSSASTQADSPTSSVETSPNPRTDPPSPPEGSITPREEEIKQIRIDPQQLMAAALTGTFRGDDTAVRSMGATGDASYIPVLLELLRYTWVLDSSVSSTITSTLYQLAGYPQDELPFELRGWGWWVEWLGKHEEVQPPAGYAAWIGQLYSSFIDPNIGDFFYDGVKSRIRLEEIVWGGVPKDGIPDLTNPPVVSAGKATYLEPSDRVFGVSLGGEHRAYPLRILNAHEMANDVVGGVPFALAY